MRLRKLSVVGFKSFVDRTDFLFDDGVTCIVGPNGCGKSNVVDAVKWVLGEQSAKSLRGGEMMDVIFNGCASRRAAGFAEVTLEFDNSAGRLQADVPAAPPSKPHLLSVTRRLYRSGESEYRINGQVARLRDIREMFMDTGLGGRSYSIIEQGKVAEMLQANPQQRREIFEDVAGISKYKARKAEAVRKLERVEQNLLRLTDIVGEVQKRLRSIKHQAGKARNYQEYSERLKQLRGLHSLAQYHTLSAHRGELQGQLDRQHDRMTGIATKIGQLEANHSSTEAEIDEMQRRGGELEGQIATVGGQVAACEERVSMLTRRCDELTEQIDAAGHRDEQLAKRIEQAEAEISDHEEQLGTVELQLRQHAEQVEAMLDEQRTGQLALTRLQGELEEAKAVTLELLHKTSQLNNQITGSAVRVEGLVDQRTRLESQQRELAEQAFALEAEQKTLQGRSAEIAEVIKAKTAELDRAKAEGLSLSAREQELDAQIQQGRQTHSRLESRRSTLAEMQRRGEGLGKGVRRVLAAKDAGELRFIRGLLADFVRADFAHAPVVAAALADLEQCLIVDSLADVSAGRDALDRALDGCGVRVLCLDQLQPTVGVFDPASLPVRADRLLDLLELDTTLSEPLGALLGRTLVVDDLPTAAAASGLLPTGYRLVTRDGAVVEVDGHVRLGLVDVAGIIARDSEMAELAEKMSQVETEVDQLTGRRRTAADGRAECDAAQQTLRTAIYEASTERVDVESRLGRIGEQLAVLDRRGPELVREIGVISDEISNTRAAQDAAHREVAELEAASAERQGRIEQFNAAVAAQTKRQEHLSRELADHRVAHAQALAQRGAIHEAVAAARRGIEQMQRERDETRAQGETGRERIATAREGILAARQQIDQLFSQQEELTQQAHDVEESRTGLIQRGESIRKALVEQRGISEEVHEQVNALRVEIGEADVRIEGLLTRTADELGLDLPAAYADYEHDDQRDWDAVAAEIQQLRGKIERLGNVNLDAITEQDELEQRERFLGEQMADIDQSKRQLTELIEKINRTSRDMFAETFAAVREQFHALFRKLFGGGRADIVLTDPEDVLESGVDIIARPPGKELRSISLLSGGEKTMTTVALVFSIFRTKPSPFCMLDEVDAALDEANNERFNLIIEEFLDQSQFIVVTHSKRTISIADVLYGVTMQEAGVSRRVSVRFDQAAAMVDEDQPREEAELFADAATGD